MFTRISVLSLFTILHIVAYSQKTDDVKDKKQVDDHSALFAHSWNLVELNGVSTMQPGMKQAFITFQEGDYNYNRISGFTGCNYIRGSVHLQGEDNITFHPDLLTNYNCAGNSVESPS